MVEHMFQKTWWLPLSTEKFAGDRLHEGHISVTSPKREFKLLIQFPLSFQEVSPSFCKFWTYPLTRCLKQNFASSRNHGCRRGEKSFTNTGNMHPTRPSCNDRSMECSIRTHHHWICQGRNTRRPLTTNNRWRNATWWRTWSATGPCIIILQWHRKLRLWWIYVRLNFMIIECELKSK